MISGGAFMFVDDGLKMPFLIVACVSIVAAGILKFVSKEETPGRDDGVVTWADGLSLQIVDINSEGFSVAGPKGKAAVLWKDIEFIMAYRTNRIPDSPIHIDLWTKGVGTIPLKDGMPGWEEFREKLPVYLQLQNYGVLESMPWTHNVMKSAVFTLLYDTEGKTMEERYNKHYSG